MNEKEVIDLCSESQTTTSDHWKAEQSKKQGNCDTEKSKTIARMESENRPEKDFQVQETEEDDVLGKFRRVFLTEEPMKKQAIKMEELTMKWKNQIMKTNMPILHYIQATDYNS